MERKNKKKEMATVPLSIQHPITGETINYQVPIDKMRHLRKYIVKTLNGLNPIQT
jgi:hypothetical protein